MANGGSINYCVRWDSSAPVTAAQRDQIHAALPRQFEKWMDVDGRAQQLAVRRRCRSGSSAGRCGTAASCSGRDSSVDIYVNNIRENAPQCSEPCGRFFHQDGNYAAARAAPPATTTCRCG